MNQLLSCFHVGDYCHMCDLTQIIRFNLPFEHGTSVDCQFVVTMTISVMVKKNEKMEDRCQFDHSFSLVYLKYSQCRNLHTWNGRSIMETYKITAKLMIETLYSIRMCLCVYWIDVTYGCIDVHCVHRIILLLSNCLDEFNRN